MIGFYISGIVLALLAGCGIGYYYREYLLDKYWDDEPGNIYYYMTDSERDYFITGYEDGWIKNDRTAAKLYKIIKSNIKYQMRKHKELEARGSNNK